MAAIDGTRSVTSGQVHALRKVLDWSHGYMCDQLGIAGGNATDTLAQIEQGRKPVTGPIANLVLRIGAEHGLTLDSASNWTRPHSRLRQQLAIEHIGKALKLLNGEAE